MPYFESKVKPTSKYKYNENVESEKNMFMKRFFRRTWVELVTAMHLLVVSGALYYQKLILDKLRAVHLKFH